MGFKKLNSQKLNFEECSKITVFKELENLQLMDNYIQDNFKIVKGMELENTFG